ncbi:MAG: hypothetical protein KatS3mg023_3874 [Armatimonadota bacterium]|nr:MAG: hypothetical protein KatS3mg023_3874 [Armatimonadota bacterium]
MDLGALLAGAWTRVTNNLEKGSAARSAFTAIAENVAKGIDQKMVQGVAPQRSVWRGASAFWGRVSNAYSAISEQARTVWDAAEQRARMDAISRIFEGLEQGSASYGALSSLANEIKSGKISTSFGKALAGKADFAEFLESRGVEEKVRQNILEAARSATIGQRAAIIGTGVVIGGGALYALNNVRRGDYFGGMVGAGIAGLGAWAALRNGVGAGLSGVMSAYEKQLIKARAQYLGMKVTP